MKKSRAASASPRQVNPIVRTGEHCPESGWWQPLSAGRGASSKFFGQGSLMPAVEGAPSFWIRTQIG